LPDRSHNCPGTDDNHVDPKQEQFAAKTVWPKADTRPLLRCPVVSLDESASTRPVEFFRGAQRLRAPKACGDPDTLLALRFGKSLSGIVASWSVHFRRK
jgi:hypothetical protein